MITLTEGWLARFAAVTRTAVLESGWDVRSCIASCRVGLEVLRYFGVAARPEPVRFEAYSADAYAWHRAHPDAPGPPLIGHSLGIRGTGAFDEAGWDGHLVLILPSGWLVDLSLDQASRPAKGLTLLPVVAPFPTGENPWQTPGAGCFIRTDGAVVVYEPIRQASAEGWRRAVDWTHHAAHRRAAAAAAIRALRSTTTKAVN